MRGLMLIAGVAVLAAGLLAAGCGGGSDADATIGKAEFVKQANAVCTDARERASNGDMGPVAKLVAILEDEADGIEELGMPARGENDIAAMLNEVREALAIISDDPKQRQKARPHIVKAERLASANGLDACLII